MLLALKERRNEMIFFKNTVLDGDGRVIEFEALDGEQILGKCTLVLGDKFADVTKLDYEASAVFAAEGLLKSAYNYAALKNYYMAKCSVEGIGSLLSRLGFIMENGEYISDIPTILMGNCGCCG